MTDLEEQLLTIALDKTYAALTPRQEQLAAILAHGADPEVVFDYLESLIDREDEHENQ